MKILVSAGQEKYIRDYEMEYLKLCSINEELILSCVFFDISKYFSLTGNQVNVQT